MTAFRTNFNRKSHVQKIWDLFMLITWSDSRSGSRSDINIVESWLKVRAIEDKTAVVVVASYHSVSRNLVHSKALIDTQYFYQHFFTSPKPECSSYTINSPGDFSKWSFKVFLKLCREAGKLSYVTTREKKIYRSFLLFFRNLSISKSWQHDDSTLQIGYQVLLWTMK